MAKLKLFILLFFLAISVPLGFVLWQTYTGLNVEEQGQMRFFSNTIFNQIEQELSELIQVEENRTVDEYSYYLASSNTNRIRSPLSKEKNHPYILGYLQNNPDDTFQTPHIADQNVIPESEQLLFTKLSFANIIFNKRKVSITQIVKKKQPEPEKALVKDESKSKINFSERYLSKSKEVSKKSYLGRKSNRIEEITPQQAYNIASDDTISIQKKDKASPTAAAPSPISSVLTQSTYEAVMEQDQIAEDMEFGGHTPNMAGDVLQKEKEDSSTEIDQYNYQAEVAPFQSVALDQNQIYLFRRIVINNQIYRQGFILEIDKLLRHLRDTHFTNQPLADFAELILQRNDQDNTVVIKGGPITTSAIFSNQRKFPVPFAFLHAELTSDNLPHSPARSSLNTSITILIGCMVFGLAALYLSARAIVDMSEKRSQFVSSVTHELKTPLTNIRMYVEMLEQGIAPTREQEQEYLEILGSESSRLSSLINNVLDLAKLEKKQHSFHLTEGDFNDVFTEIETICSQQIKQNGFTLQMKIDDELLFRYDREVMVQILFNLIENSMKFGKDSPEKSITISAQSDGDNIIIKVSDSGPGIPHRALNKVFDEFYRADNDLTRKTGGTGIGLALVKKFITAMEGRVMAKNNEKNGCTIYLQLPNKR